MSEGTLADADARRRIRDDLDVNVVVEAAAGTGKTSELVARLLSVIGSGRAELSQIAALTFTEKAAGEMKLRLRGALEDARRGAIDDATRRARFEAALSQLEAARISTIHGFCGDLLRERPIEAGVDPAFEVEGEDGSGALFERAFDGWLQATLEDPPPGVRRALRRSTPTRGAQDLLRGAARALVDQRDFDAPWQRPTVDRERRLDAMLEALGVLGSFGPIATGGRDRLAADLREILEFVDERLAIEEVRGERDYDELEFELRQLRRRWIWERKGHGTMFAPDLLRQDVVARRDEVKETLDQLLEDLEAELAALLRDELQPVVRAYEAEKARAGMLDYLDLLIRARDLVRDDAGTRAELRERITHVFVDEFQDTDPLQAEILLLLCSETEPPPTAEGSLLDAAMLPPVTAGKLFVVGDPKQAIYRFRRADVMLYERIKRGLREQGAEVLQLTTSFRSLPDIQSLVNASFAPLMTGAEDGSQAEYQPLQSYRPQRDDQPSVIALPVPRPYSQWGRITNGAIGASLPDAVGGFVEHLTQHGAFTVEEHGRTVPLSARHICLLFRAFRGYGGETTRDYVRALEARRIPHVLVGGRSFHAREEVAAVRTALCAIEWPDDALSVYAALRGPLISLSDDALLDFTAHVGALSPLRRWEEVEVTPERRAVADALTLLGDLHRARNRRPAGETIVALLEATRAHAGIAIWPTGEQALANVLRIADQARRFEQHGSTSFRAFVDFLVDSEGREEVREAPVVEEGTEGVRMMTVHAAKGLEFPVVILCDPTVPRTSQGWRSQYLDTRRRLWASRLAGCAPRELLDHADEIARHDEDEEVRVAYVAATRARDMLVVPCVGDEPRGGWVDMLHPGLYPPAGSRRNPAQAPGCPAFGHDSVLEAPVAAQRTPEDSVAPGLHRPRAGSHPVTWWDPHALRLGREGAGGLQQDRLLTADEDGDREAQGQVFHDRWKARRQSALTRGAVRGPVPQPVTSIAAEAVDPEPVAVLRTETPREGRPQGRRFGTLVHEVLADANFVANEDRLRASAELHARALGATEEEVHAAVVAVTHALGHELLVRAAASPDARFEAEMGLRLEDGRLAEGSIDLVFLEESDGTRRWTVIDFKTDLAPDGSGPYAAQVALYAEAVRRATGDDVEAFLLAV